MKRKEWFIVFLPLIIVWVLDRISKQWADGIDGIISYGLLGFVLHHNPGAMLGLFSDLPAILRVVVLSTGGAFLVCIYGLIQYLLPIKSMALRVGLSVLLGGILGNVTDRILFGHVIDFIVIGNISFASPAFNVADALQWVGYGLIVYAIIKEGDLIWPEYNLRRRYWINPKFQLKYCFLLMALGGGIGLISLVFSYTYLRVTMLELVGNNELVLRKFLWPFIATFLLITTGFSVGLFTIGKIISHKIAGPLYAFEKFLDDSLAGTNRNFKLRSQDEFKHLEAFALKVKARLKESGIVKETAELSPSTEEDMFLGSQIGDKLTENAQKLANSKLGTHEES